MQLKFPWLELVYNTTWELNIYIMENNMEWEKLMLSIDELINCPEKYYAHRVNDVDKIETLKEHTELCQKYFIRLAKNKKLDDIMKKFESKYLSDLGKKAIEIFEYMSVNIPTIHDVGKINPRFQTEKMHNEGDINVEVDTYGRLKSNHSIISSIFYLDYFMEKIKFENESENITVEEKKVLNDFAYIYAYIISRHHGNMSDFESYMHSFKKDNPDGDLGYEAYEWYKLWKKASEIGNNNNKNDNDKLFNEFFKVNDVVRITKRYDETSQIYKRMSNEDNQKCIYMYGWTKLLYSLLVASDYYATSEFMNGIKTTDSGEIKDIDNIDKIYRESVVQQSIKTYKENIYPMPDEKLKYTNDINNLRSEMYIDAEKELLNNLDMNLFYLEAPTGSGKSNTAMNLSFKLIKNCSDINKILYIYPYNTLVEQNISSMENIFGGNKKIMSQIAVVNSINPYKNKLNNSEDENMIDKDYQRILLDRQFLNYPIILSTHVTLFNTLFNNKKEDVFGFHQICNSVIVMDEIQTYKNSLWGEIVTFLNAYARLFNIKIIIMSATLPDLDKFINDNSSSIKLIKDTKKYFNNQMFAKRVVPDYSLLKASGGKTTLEKLKLHVLKNKNKRVLIEFIKKKTAQEFYKLIKNEVEKNGITVRLMTGDSNIQERKNIIAELEKINSVILVATQVIEAGVDIDMDIGYKDISRLDSEEQFMGRINRSCKKSNCVVYFFNYDNANMIYHNDARLNSGKTLECDNIKNILDNKDFSKFYELVFEDLKYEYSRYGKSNMSDFFKEYTGHLAMNKVAERMKLIDDNMVKIYVYLNINKPEYSYNADELWKEYKALLSDPELINNRYPEKKVRLQEVRSKMNVFMYQIQPDLLWVKDYEQIGNIYYINNGEDYIDEYGVIKSDMIKDNEELFL